jgi:hypothetical protein
MKIGWRACLEAIRTLPAALAAASVVKTEAGVGRIAAIISA